MAYSPKNPPFTSVHNSPNRSPRQNVPRRGVVLHHGATTSLDALNRLTMGAKQVSATCNCKDELLPVMVPNDNDRPWSLSSAYWDSAMRSVETANESTNGWTLSDESHWTLAKVVAYWATTDGFWPHREGDPKTWTVIGHREVFTIHQASYATACPGGMNLDLIVRRAQELLRGTTDTTTKEEPQPFWKAADKENNMLFLIAANDAEGRWGKPRVHYALTGPDYWVEVSSTDAANTLAVRFGNAANVTYGEWDAFKAAAVKK